METIVLIYQQNSGAKATLDVANLFRKLEDGMADVRHER